MVRGSSVVAGFAKIREPVAGFAKIRAASDVRGRASEFRAREWGSEVRGRRSEVRGSVGNWNTGILGQTRQGRRTPRPALHHSPAPSLHHRIIPLPAIRLPDSPVSCLPSPSARTLFFWVTCPVISHCSLAVVPPGLMDAVEHVSNREAVLLERLLHGGRP